MKKIIALFALFALFALAVPAAAQSTPPEWPEISDWHDYSTIRDAWKASTGCRLDPWEWAAWLEDPSDDDIDSRATVYDSGESTFCEITLANGETCLECVAVGAECAGATCWPVVARTAPECVPVSL